MMTIALPEKNQVENRFERPAICVDTFLDAAALDDLIGPSGECLQLGAGSLVAEVESRRLGKFRIFQHRCNVGTSIRGMTPPNTLLIGGVTSGRMLEHGRPWAQEHLLISCGGSVHLSSLSSAAVRWLQIDLRSLSQVQRDALGPMTPGSTRFLVSDPRLVEVFWTTVVDALRRRPLRNGLPFYQESLSRIEDCVLAHAAAVLAANRSDEPEGSRTQRRRYSLVERVEAFMWNNVEEPLTLERICAAMHCRVRSLIYSFKDTIGIGPMTYLKILRLNAVRRKLQSAAMPARVFDIAADFGFWHMGHFTTDYKRLFGTTASQAKLRSPQTFPQNE